MCSPTSRHHCLELSAVIFIANHRDGRHGAALVFGFFFRAKILNNHITKFQRAEWIAHRGDHQAPDRPISVYEVHAASWRKHGGHDGVTYSWRDLTEHNRKETEQFLKLREELSTRVGILEKWRHLIIGGAIVIGFILQKFLPAIL